MYSLTGPGSAYTLLFDDAPAAPGIELPSAFQDIYGGGWVLPPAHAQRPYTFTNFVASHDGRISFAEKGRSGGGDISRHSTHDAWLMALIRARADAIITGTGTLRMAKRHLWTPEQIFPADKEAFATLRAQEKRSPVPLVVVISNSGDLPEQAQVLEGKAQPVLIATSESGAKTAQAKLGEREGISYFVTPGESVDLAALMHELRTQHHVESLLSEGGAQIYASLIQAQLIDEVFLTISPIVVGNSEQGQPRPSLVEGVRFSPDRPPQLELLSLRRKASHLFERARFTTSA